VAKLAAARQMIAPNLSVRIIFQRSESRGKRIQMLRHCTLNDADQICRIHIHYVRETTMK